ncbi:MAG: 4-hydroxy-tetrahydrodipicolinate reductase [Endozoicomonas sp. (ex Botrylloides leachii)]|nr:4-hydroxy-tetrahydrodipicolinate reductase [Endozoicomonas sp. (ex Botrylloides leachii)]
MIKVAIVGAAGRMGRMLMESVVADNETTLSAGIVSTTNGLQGIDCGELIGAGNLGVALTTSLAEVIDTVDAVIDFTCPTYTMENAAICAQHKKTLVIGTTGLTDQQQQQLKVLSQKTPIVCAPNMSTGVNLVFKVLETVAKVLDGEADVEVVEMHHRSKVDAPSGTSLKMAEIVAKATHRSLEECAVYGREGQVGVRKRETIGFSTMRGGDVIGDHTMLFACEGERIEITHKASSRMIYAKGSVRAVKFLATKQAGFYSMTDVLGL